MPYTKTIVCLANSRKLAGRCVAGKEWDGQKIGAWCRPVSARDRGELTAERWYRKTWRDPQLLDLIEVACSGRSRQGFKRKITWSIPLCVGDSLDALPPGSY